MADINESSNTDGNDVITAAYEYNNTTQYPTQIPISATQNPLLQPHQIRNELLFTSVNQSSAHYPQQLPAGTMLNYRSLKILYKLCGIILFYFI